MNRSIIIINKLALGGAEEFFCELGERFSDHYTFAVLENDYSYNVRFKLKKYLSNFENSVKVAVNYILDQKNIY